MTDLPHSIEEATVIRRDDSPDNDTFHFARPTDRITPNKRQLRRELYYAEGTNRDSD